MVGEELPPLTPDVVAAAARERKTTTAVELPPPPDNESRRPWGLLAGVAIGLGIVWFLFAVVFNSGDGDEVAATTTQPVPETSTTEGPTTTTEISTTTTTPETTSTATTTTTTTSTTTTTTTTLAPIEAEGSPIPVGDLTLGAFALGPFSFDSGTPYLGRLVASLGQPDSRTPVGTEMGLCDGEEGVAYTWDGLTGIFRVEDDEEILVGYRLVDTGSDRPVQSITTRSGLELGHTVATLDAIYLQSGLAFEDIDGTPHFILLRSTDDATLLWGPVSSTDAEGIVEGIYSPRACDGGPFATP